MSIIETVADLRKRLERYSSEQADDKKFVKVLKHLDTLDISVQCLEKTGIGKTVNGLKKHDGEIGSRSRDLVAKWKTLSLSQPPSTSSHSDLPQKTAATSSNSQPSSSGRNSSKSNGHANGSLKRSIHESQSGTGSSRSQASGNLNQSIAMLPDLEDDLLGLLSSPNTSFNSTLNKSRLSSEEATEAPLKKTRMTKMFSGRVRSRGLAEVPTLKDLCIRVLLDHINDIEEIGGVPYDIIKPVLDACNPKQLRRIEDFNPDLLFDTDELWQKHCEKDFHVKELDDSTDNFRDLYELKQIEKEKKLESLTKTIAQRNKERAAPVRQTQVAEFATRVHKGRVQPAVAQPKLSAGASGSGDIRSKIRSMGVPSAPVRGRNWNSGSSSSSLTSSGQKRGSLMAKTIKAFKNQIRR